MTIEQTVCAEYFNDYRNLHTQLPGHNLQWCEQWRDDAMSLFATQGFPSLRNESWKYTDLRSLAQHHFKTPYDNKSSLISSKKITREYLKKYEFIDNANTTLVFVNDELNINLSSLLPNNKSLKILTLKQAFKQCPELLENYLGKTVYNTDSITSLNTAMMKQGAFIHVLEGNYSDKPIQLIFINTGNEEFINHSRNLILIEANAQANFMESHIDYSEQRFVSTCLTEIVLKENAELEYNIIIHNNKKSYHLGASHIKLEENSLLNLNQFLTSGRVIRRDLIVNHDAPNSHCQLRGLSLTKGRMHTDTNVCINHLQPKCKSDQFFKSVVDDAARSVFTGRVFVAKDAQLSHACQTNKNILLSDKAEADSRPQLEIYADDVQCSHGSTIGQLDEQAILYLRSRAIDESQARAMLVKAFASDTQTNINSRYIKNWLNREIDNYISI